MNRKNVFFLTLTPLFLMIALPLHADEVRLSVSASMANVFKDVAHAFEADNPDVVVRLNVSSSGSLARQIAHGAPADLFVSANPKWLTFLGEKGKTNKRTVRVLAFNSLVVVGNPALSISSLSDLSLLKRIALGSPGSVPAGHYAKQAMTHAGVYNTLLDAHKLVIAKDVRQALLYADRKEVEAAFVYKTDALLAQTARILYPVPTPFYDRVSYPMALTKTGATNPSAKVFYAFLASPDVLKILEHYGFETSIVKPGKDVAVALK